MQMREIPDSFASAASAAAAHAWRWWWGDSSAEACVHRW
jgi:hypothetical protein